MKCDHGLCNAIYINDHAYDTGIIYHTPQWYCSHLGFNMRTLLVMKIFAMPSLFNVCGYLNISRCFRN